MTGDRPRTPTRGRIRGPRALLALVVLCLGGVRPPSSCVIGNTPPIAPSPPTETTDLAALGLTLSSEWTNPRPLRFGGPTQDASAINLVGNDGEAGWEDSPYISWDGTTLYFGYSQWDPVTVTPFGGDAIGPTRDGQNGPRFDVYNAYISQGAWFVSNLRSVTQPTRSINTADEDAAVGVDRTGNTLVFTDFTNPTDAECPGWLDADSRGNLVISHYDYGAATWLRDTQQPAISSLCCTDDNPHIRRLDDGRSVVYWDSSRPVSPPPSGPEVCESYRRVLYSILDPAQGASAPAPLILPEMPASELTFGGQRQPYVSYDGAEVYWLGRDGSDCWADLNHNGQLDPGEESGGCVYRATLAGGGDPNGAGPYAGRELVIRPYPPGAPDAVGKVVGIGEISITGDGRYMYFAYATLSGFRANHNPILAIAIGVATKAGG